MVKYGINREIATCCEWEQSVRARAKGLLTDAVGNHDMKTQKWHTVPKKEIVRCRKSDIYLYYKQHRAQYPICYQTGKIALNSYQD